MATMYEFVDNVSCNNCIYWSKDHRIALCTDSSIKILKIVSSVKNTEPKLFCQQSVVPINPDVLDIPEFSGQNYQDLLKSLQKDVEMQLIIDKVLNPFKFSQNTVPVTGFIAAAWSPVGASISGGCILATLSRDFRLMIYTQRMSVFKWFEVCDLSKKRLEESRPGNAYRKPDKLHYYREWCYGQAYSALTWSPVLHRDEKNGVEYAVLVAGTKSGEIVLWKTKVPADTGADCILYKSFSIHKGQVTDLSWSEWTGTLAIGYLDGQIHVVQINMTDPMVEPTPHCLHGDSDLLRVCSLCFVPDKQQGGEILLANKEDCVLGFHLDPRQNLQSNTLVRGESTLHGTGMCWIGDNSVLLTSVDSVIQIIQVSTEQGDLRVTIKRLETNLPVPFDRPAVCQGVTASPNQVFLAFLQRPTPGYDHLTPMYKAPTKVHITPVSKFEDNTWAVTPDELGQRLKDEKGLLDAKLDVIELLRHTILATSGTTHPIPEVGASPRDLMLHRYVLLVKLCQLQNRQDREIEEEAVQEAVSNMTSNLIQTTLQILALHIRATVERIREISCDIKKDKSVKVLKTMKTFLEANHDQLLPLDMGDTAQQLTDLIGQSDVAMETECAICSCNLTQAQLQLKCCNGHVFEQCCQTFQPCEVTDYWKCTVCGALSLSPELLKEFDWLGDAIRTCVLCEGLME